MTELRCPGCGTEFHDEDDPPLTQCELCTVEAERDALTAQLATARDILTIDEEEYVMRGPAALMMRFRQARAALDATDTEAGT